MISIRPFSRCYQGEESLDIFFSEEQRVAFPFSFTLALLRVVITFKTWVKSNFWIQHLREGQSSWWQVSWQVFALRPPSAALPLSSFFLPTLFLATAPPPPPLIQFAQYSTGAPSKQEEFAQLLPKTHKLKHLLLHYIAKQVTWILI